MKKKQKQQMLTIGILFLVCVITIVAYVMVSNRKEAAEKKAKRQEEENVIKLYSVEEANIEKIYFKNKYGDFTITRSGDSWQKEDEPAFPLNQDYVATMLVTISTVEAESIVKEEMEDSDKKDYGLDKPEMTVKIETSSGREKVIYLGKESMAGGGRYAYMEGDNTAYIVTTDIYNSFRYTDNQMMEIESFPAIESDYVSLIDLESKDEDIFKAVYEVSDSEFKDWESWSIEEPYAIHLPGTSVKINTLANRITGIKYDECVTYGVTDKELKEYKLKDPKYTLKIAYNYMGGESSSDSKDKDEKADSSSMKLKYYTVYIGKKTKDEGSYYVMPEDSDRVYLTSAEVMDKVVNLTPRTYVYPYFYRTDASNIEKVTAKIDGKTYEYEITKKEKDEIKIPEQELGVTETPDPGFYSYDFTVKSDGKKVDAEKFMEYYKAFGEISHTSEVKEKKDTDLVYSIEFKEKDKTKTLEFYEYDKDNFYKVSVDGKEAVFVADISSVDKAFNALK
ncbi:MAG: DUF4340 domain-containing protein [Lachnospiraceae bacterium]|nr:DUF4340 domain-containing protein [Lachnospiraceae bacterium]